MKGNVIIGLHGCSCHPFDSWYEHDKFHNQKIEIENEYIIRHSGLRCIVKGFLKEFPNYVEIIVEPFDCPRCNQIEHKSNLIKV